VSDGVSVDPGTAVDAGAQRYPSPLHLIWRRLARPFNLVTVIPAMCGIPSRDVADLITAHLALSVEAEALVSDIGDLLRNLRSSTAMESTRCSGYVRGQILWAETLTARANGFGADDIYICGMPRRDFDTSENQVLVAALQIIMRSALALDTNAARHLTDAQRETVMHRSLRARTALRSEQLRDVRRGPLRGRALSSARHGRRANQYRHAVDMLTRRSEPIRPSELLDACDEVTVGQHRALGLVMIELQQQGVTVPRFVATGGELVAGPLRYRNWLTPDPAGDHGIFLGDVLIDGSAGRSDAARGDAMEQLGRRGRGRRICVVTDGIDAHRAVAMALRA